MSKTILIIGGIAVAGGVALYLYNRNKNQIVETDTAFENTTAQAIKAIETKVITEAQSVDQEKLYNARLAELIKQNKLCNSSVDLIRKPCREAMAKLARKEFPKLSGFGSPYLMS